MAREISATNFEIAGITLGLSTDQDAERVFGPAPAVDTPDHEGARRCYVSAKGDGTVLELESWVGTLIRFRLESALCESKPSCAQAALVSNKLTTGAGLKLGLLRKQIVEILGPPTAIHGSRLTYERSFDRPLTAEEEKRLKEKGGPPWDVKSVHVDDKIEIVLSNSKVVSIDVLHNETD
ncbi:MAG: hypothetical protein LAN62_14150 [Acidobacteriia bacterium]|nr:hypothetical protein [Terriglobia bacterium]